MWQAEHVAALLADHGIATKLVPLVSTGDVDMRPIDGTRQVGVFTKRIQQALVDDEADVACHSLKDLPTEVDKRFTLAAVPGRETVADCLVSPTAWTIDQLPQGAKIGTGSKRRAAQLRHLRPDLDVQPIRGNVQTRLSKLDDKEFDAIMLANAGLLRLKMDDLSRSVLPLDQMLPAPGQGALGIEVRSDDAYAIESLQKLDDPNARAAVVTERTLLAQLNGGCLAPIAALATCDSKTIEVTAMVLSADGSQRLHQTGSQPIDTDAPETWPAAAIKLAESVAGDLTDQGAKELIDAAR